MPSASEILLEIPEFASATPVSWAIALAEARTADLPAWGDDDELRNLAIALRAAHILKMVGRGFGTAPGAGPVASEKIGSLSVTYAVGDRQDSEAPTMSDLWLTPYGRQLLALMSENFPGMMTTYTG